MRALFLCRMGFIRTIFFFLSVCVSSRANASPPCVMVFRHTNSREPVLTLCAVNSNLYQQPCVVHPRDFGGAITSPCQGSPVLNSALRANYIQSALYWASGRDDSGFVIGTGRAQRIVLSNGVHMLNHVMSSWYPYGNSTLLRVPSNVTLEGSSTLQGSLSGTALTPNVTCLQLWPMQISGNSKTNSVPTTNDSCIAGSIVNGILVSNFRVGRANMSTSEFLSGAENVVLIGFSFAAGLQKQPNMSLVVENTISAVGNNISISTLHVAGG